MRILRRHGSEEGSDDDNPPPSTLPAEPTLECAPQSATTTEGEDTSSDKLVKELAGEHSNTPEVEREGVVVVDNATLHQFGCSSIEDILTRLPAPLPTLSHRNRCSLTFPHPRFEGDDFELRVDYQNVALEYCFNGGNNDSVLGFVRVRNLAYYKHVFVRFTRNDWATFEDVQAQFVSTEQEGHNDRFIFELPVNPELGPCIGFAICYSVNGQDYWDNNDNENYRINVMHRVNEAN